MRAGRYLRWNGMTWPLTDDDLNWRLRYAPETITRGDQLYLASLIGAYRDLIRCPLSKRREVVRTLRAAIAAVERAS